MKAYIGIDLGAWYGNKTSIAVLKHINNKLTLITLCNEEKETRKKPPQIRNDMLVKKIKLYIESNAIVAIDAPFSIPSFLKNSSVHEKICYEDNTKNREIDNQYIYDNSARFVFKITGEKVLAPAGDKIGKMTARMADIIDRYSDELGIIKTPELFDQKNTGITTIEVYPRATLKQLSSSIPPYKTNKNNFNVYKNEMIELLEKLELLTNTKEELYEQIKSDDDYDAVICALTAYLIDQHSYVKPVETQKFTNSFIFIPNIRKHQNYVPKSNK